MEASGVFARRLRAARARARMSQRELARRAGLSAMAISKYERGLMLPGSPTLLRLARALGVGVEFLLRPGPVRVEAVAYRSHPRVPAAARHEAEALVADWVERYREVEDLAGAPLPATDVPPADGLVAGGDPEEAAEVLRRRWGLGLVPIPSMVSVLEEHGIRVGFLPLPEGIDAMSFRVQEAEPCIVVRPDVPGDRQRFSLAHELAHLAWPGGARESDYHRFAAAFLVPAASARAQLGERRKKLGLDELLLLKRAWGLSIQGWTRRAAELGIIGRREAGRWRRLFRENRWLVREPGPGYPSERSDRFALLLVRAVREGLIHERRAAELAGVPWRRFLETNVPHRGEGGEAMPA